jgi:Ca2+-transporting ATPase
MRRQPRSPRAGIFTRPVLALMLTGGLWTGLVNLGLFAWLVRTGRPREEAMALTFVLLVLIQFFNAYNYRSDRLSVVQQPLANRWLNVAIVWELVLLMLIVYLPFFHEPFGTFPLSPGDWALTCGLAFTVVPVLETVKWMRRRGWMGQAV